MNRRGCGSHSCLADRSLRLSFGGRSSVLSVVLPAGVRTGWDDKSKGRVGLFSTYLRFVASAAAAAAGA